MTCTKRALIFPRLSGRIISESESMCPLASKVCMIEIVELWMRVSMGNMQAAHSLSLAPDMERSAINRAYYAAFAAAHAICLHYGQIPRVEYRTWTHEKLPGTLFEAATNQGGIQRQHDQTLRLGLERCRQHRLIADYCPEISVDRAACKEALRLAGQVVNNARRLFNA